MMSLLCFIFAIYHFAEGNFLTGLVILVAAIYLP